MTQTGAAIALAIATNQGGLRRCSPTRIARTVRVGLGNTDPTQQVGKSWVTVQRAQ